jgi:predicted NACHT family NTPase
MPRNIRWDESVKENALNLVEALLKQADNEFDDLELNAAVDVEWLTENKLRVTGKEKQKRGKREQIVEVGTRKEHLVKLVNKTGKSLNLPQRKKESGSSQQERELEEVQTALDCLRELGVFEEEKNTRKNQGYWKFTLTLKHQTATREENLEAVKQKWKEHPKTNSLVTSSTTPILETEKSIDWRDVCRNRLEKQKQLTTNRLMSAKQMLFDINQICVDLALVERKQPDKRSGDDNPEQSQLYKPDYEETQKLEYEEFLATVLKASQSNKIAIIGEPGAGKTTLLQRIAFWILDNTDGLPIWIPLGILPTPAPKLKDYLLNNWLEDAILNVTPKIRAEFEELLTAGRVWLLLDGVDEMVANSGNPLSFIDNWIPGWCQHLSVVLTCRLNVWEANPLALNNFQTYRTLEFSQEKVIEFIEACFQKSDPELGIQLQQALNQPGKERIKDLMRNPLRLTLLCSTWHLREGKLPDTKAELYQQYVEEVYRWKKDEFPTTPEQRQQLNAKLKELALAAIDKEENRFCLRHKFVEGILGDRDGCVFQLALNIGWLNRVGVDAKNPNPNQPVYAFFHPTFQEYFAALAIADWDFFLPRAHDNHNPKPVSERYRIFEPQWKEVFLLWLGRKDEYAPPEQREMFIESLIHFKDGCQKFYSRRSYLLAAAGIAEFRSPSHADEIVRTVARVGCCDFDLSLEESLLESSRAVLLETDRSIAIASLVNIVRNSKEGLGYAAEILSKIGQNNQEAITALTEKIPQVKNEQLCWQVAKVLIKLDPSNSTAITALINLIRTSQDEESIIQATITLGQVTSGNLDAIAALTELLNSTSSGVIAYFAAESLVIINPGNTDAISALNQLKPPNFNEVKEEDYERSQLQYQAILNKHLTPLQKNVFLGNLNPNKQLNIDSLVTILNKCEVSEHERIEYKEWLNNLRNRDFWPGIHTFTFPENISNTWEKYGIYLSAIEKLLEIEPDNSKVISAFTNLLCPRSSTLIPSTENIYGDWRIQRLAQGLVNIRQSHHLRAVITGLNNLLHSLNKSSDSYNFYYGILWHYAQNMTYPAFYQAWHQQEEAEKTTIPDRQTLNQADLPQSLQSAIANDPQLSQIIHLICIDGSEFIERDRPAAEIYDQMLDQNCPECASVPETMPALKLYWNSLKRNSDKRVVLVFYASSTDTTPDEGTALPCPYSSAFLTDLSKFGREICVITEQPFNHIPLKFFAPIQPIADIVQWIRAIVLEN